MNVCVHAWLRGCMNSFVHQSVRVCPKPFWLKNRPAQRAVGKSESSLGFWANLPKLSVPCLSGISVLSAIANTFRLFASTDLCQPHRPADHTIRVAVAAVLWVCVRPVGAEQVAMMNVDAGVFGTAERPVRSKKKETKSQKKQAARSRRESVVHRPRNPTRLSASIRRGSGDAISALASLPCAPQAASGQPLDDFDFDAWNKWEPTCSIECPTWSRTRCPAS